MKTNQLRSLSADELKTRLKDAEEEMANLKFQLALHQLDNPVKVRAVRKDIARIKTLLHQQVLAAAKTQAPK
ncbi:MAG: 50S ribosomal protein L29 [bacterium]|nr:50S ribosomal protein L29 [bacterium]